MPRQEITMEDCLQTTTHVSPCYKDDECDEDVLDFPKHEASAETFSWDKHFITPVRRIPGCSW